MRSTSSPTSIDPLDDFQDLAEGVTRDVTFSYTATDGDAVSDEAIATITVTGINDAPTIDLSDDTGVADALPTGNLDAPNRKIDLEIDLSSSDANISSINMLDLGSFTNDGDGDAVTLNIDLTQGTAFRAVNMPMLDNGVLSWTPTAEDVADGYIIRISGQDLPPNGMNAMPLEAFDLAITVVAANPPEVSSVTQELDIAQAPNPVVIVFDEPMGASAADTANYTLTVADGGMIDAVITISDASQNGDSTEVTLTIDDAAVLAAFEDASPATQLRLTLDAAITDSDGNALTGATEFLIDVVDNTLVTIVDP